MFTAVIAVFVHKLCV